MPATCPRDGSELVEVERSGVRIDACRTCRGVWLDRGELDKILEREGQAFAQQDQDDEAFLKEVTGAGGQAPPRGAPAGFDRKTAERIFDEFKAYKHGSHGHHGHHRKKRKSFLEQLLD
ncbi:zf-TFIIB domain-containing protein [Conexibacter sp. SYSU D00693]|uniref:TFIIB-type zinc ribbon-containing protein n=1 Tax=Conexibacter sp. SYSU D00693 TaxID=2812560 RepID=UPI00196A457A|nr:zf-TFIIB domain-containing protein [Conexibacter sp. SYSU D00693]